MRSLDTLRNRRRFAAVLILASVAAVFGQGDLDPPGAPAPTMKTLEQVEARIIVNPANTPGDEANSFIISQPGSYYLTGNLTGEPDKHGLSVQADDVSLDLNGFALISGGGADLRGVNVPAEQRNFSVRNGIVKGWTGGGVRAEASRNVLAEKLRLSENAGAIGLYVGLGSLIKDCAANANETGFRTPDRSQIISCISTENTGNGFECTSFLTIVDCTSSRNGGNGIVVEGSSHIVRCSASRNELFGINARTGCSISDSNASSNVKSGISVDAGSTVRGCTAQGNLESGIRATSRCQLTGNSCDANLAGIKVTGNNNRIDENICTVNDDQRTNSLDFYGSTIWARRIWSSAISRVARVPAPFCGGATSLQM